jgi:hypothetical protein
MELALLIHAVDAQAMKLQSSILKGGTKVHTTAWQPQLICSCHVKGAYIERTCVGLGLRQSESWAQQQNSSLFDWGR